ncbi:hypothetical protein M9Y10_004391 [Tritrichomonas musculus]|uniref:Phosphatase 2A Regulatory Subunit A helical domain-containing protein n=1 Tax=Tritrichomonas musculus TaxID=1915356 RepID=A0ABR2JRY0_9EUKA
MLGSVETLLELLLDEDPITKIDAIKQFGSVSQDDREKLFEKVLEDLSHEVREEAANNIEFCPSMYKKYLADPDPRVRIAIIRNSVKIRKTETDILKTLKGLIDDPDPEVRCAFAKILQQHSEYNSGNKANDDKVLKSSIIPTIELLLSDQADIVRITASDNIKYLTIQRGFDFVFEELQKSLNLILTDPQWRIRINGVSFLFGLARVCEIEFFNNNLLPFLLQFLKDPSMKIRQFATQSLPALAIHFGEEWLKVKLVKDLQTLAESNNLFYRQTYLNCLSQLVEFFPVEYQSNYVFQEMIRMLKDKEQNVVILAIDLLSKHKQSIHPFKIKYELKPIITKLAENSPPTIKSKAAKFIEDLN